MRNKEHLAYYSFPFGEHYTWLGPIYEANHSSLRSCLLVKKFLLRSVCYIKKMKFEYFLKIVEFANQT